MNWRYFIAFCMLYLVVGAIVASINSYTAGEKWRYAVDTLIWPWKLYEFFTRWPF